MPTGLGIDAVLEVGDRSDAVTVFDNQVQVDTTSTQIGEVITGTQMTAVPLNGRSYTDLLALQPGVAPVTSITSDTVQDVGASALSPSGDLNPGTISINGQREFANAFIVNGSDVEEDVNMGAAIIPNLDSIAEFRILTSNFDAEYGEFSGGQINVVTKSGANAFHGDVFEFLRNTNLDARNYFSPTRGAFDQNQFGGTVRRPHPQEQDFLLRRLPRHSFDAGRGHRPDSRSVRAGPHRQSDTIMASAFVIYGSQTAIRYPTTVSGPNWAGHLSDKLGYTVSAGERTITLPDAPAPAVRTCVFPNAVIPQTCLVAPGNQSFEIHSRAQQCERHVLHLSL